MMAPLAATVARLVSCSTLPLWRSLSLGPPTHSPFAGVSSRGLFVSAPFARHMLAFPLTLASSSGARSQPQSIASRSSTQAPRFFLRRTPTFGSPSSSSVVRGKSMHLFCPLCRRSCSLIPWCSEPPRCPHPPLWCRSGHHSLFTFSPGLRHYSLWFQLLFTCASLLPPTLFRPHAVLLSSLHSPSFSASRFNPFFLASCTRLVYCGCCLPSQSH